ncbi:MAG: hypothetical protein A3F17_07995 [Gammaproteobacteria bacterium RIFCSPHIGHO2_12_FULL_41_15]|nr:MAG: hypothetical protein A3F17_07995 [Gammaproteobacteria bacterium RIFCSPHIGHO2_12_FULL_41_15]
MEVAQYAVTIGVDYLGLVFCPFSSRYLDDLVLARDITTFAKKNGVTPVAVFNHHTTEEMEKICKHTTIETIQLHGSLSQQEQNKLSAAFKRIIVITVDERGYYELPFGLINSLNLERDFLLFDYKIPGSGKSFNHQMFFYGGDFRYFIAGGLLIENVAKYVQQFQPFGVDVSSGVEKIRGYKDFELMNTFLKEVRHA